LTMRPALRSIFAHAFRRLAVAGVPESWWAPISASPRRDAPRSAALSSAGEECASTSDAPCRDVRRAFGPLPAARTAFPQSPVKGPDFVRSEAPSIDECPLDAPDPLSERRTNLEREPATGLGALPPVNPASDALSPPRSGEEAARPRPLPCALHARALLATRRSSTSAIETICKHDLRTSKPGDARGTRLSPGHLILRDRSSSRSGHRRFDTPAIQSRGSRGFTGQGPLSASRPKSLCRPPPR
jgi:hypothetical protein